MPQGEVVVARFLQWPPGDLEDMSLDGVLLFGDGLTENACSYHLLDGFVDDLEAPRCRMLARAGRAWNDPVFP